MSPSRHRAARPALRVRVGKLAVPAALATTLTGAVVAVGMTMAKGDDAPVEVVSADRAMRLDVSDLGVSDPRERKIVVSRTAPRVELEPEAVAKRFATADLNIWSRPTERSRNLGLVEDGSRVAVTGQVVDGWAEVLLKGQVRYVNAKYLSDDKPEEDPAAPAVAAISAAPCPDGSGTESGLTSDAVRLFRAVCAAFPGLTTYGGWDNHGEHADGRAVDFMTYENQALGQAIANWALLHAGELNIRTIIFAQRIWTSERAGEGWRFMSDRGSVTANHYDHPHISVH